MKAAFFTLGCKVNQYETQVMAEKFSKAGFEIVSHNDEADIYIVNSCTVTGTSDKKTRQYVRRFKNLHPNAITVLTGCMPQAYPTAACELVQADIVLGNRNTDIIIDAIEEYILSGKRIFNVKNTDYNTNEEFENMSISSFNERTRAFVKIEDGCNCFCSYCIIPFARGPVRSKPLEELEYELSNLEKSGFTEIVLVGINLSSYGRDLGIDICDAVSLACSFDGFKRVRLGSLEPDHITEDIINRLSENKKLCPHFHVSLQSGCNETLNRMNRHYTSEEYLQMCINLRNAFPNCAITTDIMVGFAGETDEEFKASIDFAKAVGFSKIHVFSYSRRTGTRAAKFENQISNQVKELRTHKMIQLADKMQKKFLNAHVGKATDVLFESKSKGGFYSGYTADYIEVRAKCDTDIRGKVCSVLVCSVKEDFSEGKIIDVF